MEGLHDELQEPDDEHTDVVVPLNDGGDDELSTTATPSTTKSGKKSGEILQKKLEVVVSYLNNVAESKPARLTGIHFKDQADAHNVHYPKLYELTTQEEFAHEPISHTEYK